MIRAVECGLRSIAQNRTYTAAYKLLILALVLAGREAEAQPYVPQLLKAEPGFTVERYRRRFPGSATPTGQLYCEALARGRSSLVRLKEFASRTACSERGAAR